jgi:Acyl-CoA carboxylase epsilon subunit
VTGPLFHVKRGDPTPEELAALTAVLAAKAAAAARARRRHAGPPRWAGLGLWTAAGTPPAARLRSPTGWGSRAPGVGWGPANPGGGDA